MSSRVVIPPSSANLPVTLEQVRFDCKIDDSGDPAIEELVNETLTLHIITAVGLCMQKTQRSVVRHTRLLTLDAFPCDINLPYPSIISIESVRYWSALTETQVVLSNNQYSLDVASDYEAWLLAAPSVEWPQTMSVAGAVEIRYQAGYVTPAEVPAQVKTWIRSVVKFLYENEGCELPRNFNASLLDSFKSYA